MLNGYYYCLNCHSEITPDYNEHCPFCGTTAVAVSGDYSNEEVETAFDLLKKQHQGLIAVFDVDVISPENRPLIQTVAGMPVNEVIDLVKAKQEGRIIVPPCKIGDTVYLINEFSPVNIAKFTVEALHITSGKNRLGHKQPSHALLRNCLLKHLSTKEHLENFGKTVFLTRKEAERKLEQ